MFASEMKYAGSCGFPLRCRARDGPFSHFLKKPARQSAFGSQKWSRFAPGNIVLKVACGVPGLFARQSSRTRPPGSEKLK